MASKRRKYSDEEKSNALAALAANGGNVLLTARQLGIPRKTLERWAKGNVHPQVAQDGHKKRGQMADCLEEIAWQLAEALPSKIASASLSQTATSLGIAIDKMRLLREQATSITAGIAKMADDEIRKEIDRVRARPLELVERRTQIAGRIGVGTGDGGTQSTGKPAVA